MLSLARVILEWVENGAPTLRKLVKGNASRVDAFPLAREGRLYSREENMLFRTGQVCQVAWCAGAIAALPPEMAA